MRSLFLLIVLFLFPFMGKGQSFNWENIYEGTGTDFASSIFVDHDTVYLASYSTSEDIASDYFGGSDIVISKSDPYGKMLWTIRLGGSGDDAPYRIFRSSDGNIIVVGYTTSDDHIFLKAHGNMDGFILCIDTRGNFLWSNQYGGAGDDVLLSACTSEDGSVYVAGVSDSNDNGLKNNGLLDAWISKINLEGTIEWTRTYGGQYNDMFLDIKSFGDKRIVACGRTQYAEEDVAGFSGSVNNGMQTGWIVALDEMGVIQNQNFYGNSEESDVSFNSVLKFNNGNILVGGLQKHKALLVDYSEELKVNQSYRYGVEGVDFELSQIIEDNQMHLYLVGTKIEFTSKPNEESQIKEVLVLEISKTFEVLATEDFDFEGESWGSCAAIDRKGGLIVGGGRETHKETGGQIDIFVTRLCPGYKYETDILLCGGDSVEIGSGFIKEEGIYVDSLLSLDGCDSLLSYHVEFFPVDTMVTVDGATLTSMQPEGSYQWYSCISLQAIESETGRSFTVSESGEYMVKIEVGECRQESKCVFVAAMGNGNRSRGGFNLSPNPTFTKLRLENIDLVYKSGQVIDIMGISRIEFENFGNSIEIDVSLLPAGLYYVRMSSNDDVVSRAFVKR